MIFSPLIILANPTPLTSQEEEWLKEHDGKLRLAPCPNWEPMEILDEDGTYRGVIADYIHLIEKKLNFKFKIIRVDTWLEILEMARNRQLDVISGGEMSPERQKFMNWTAPYYISDNTIISKKSLKGELNIRRILQSKLALGIPKGYHTNDLYRKTYPDLNIVDTDNLLDGLKRVSFGEIDAVIAEVPHALHYIEKFSIPNLRLAGVSDYKTSCSIGTRSDWPILHSILSKGVAMITEKEHRIIHQRWVKLTPMYLHQFRTFWYVVCFLLMLSVAVLFWNKFLKRQVNRKTEEFRSSEKLFRDLVENSPTAISIIQAGRVLYKNPKQEGMPEILLPLEIDTFSHILPECRDEVSAFFQAIKQNEAEFQTQDEFQNESEISEIDFGFLVLRKKNRQIHKETKWINCRACQIMYQGRPSILLNAIDRSRSKKMERLLLIQEKMASLGHICAGIAHEVRNPLAAINIHIRNLEKIYSGDAKFAQKIETCFRLIHSDSDRIESVIRRTLDFAKPHTLSFAKIDINVSLKRVAQLTETTLRHQRITIQSHVSEPLPFCYAETQLIEDVIYNLIINAADAMKDITQEKKIVLSSFANARHVLVLVDDTGPGVPRKIRTKVFDPFFTTKNSSTGIGLNICHRVITDHRGSIGVKSNKWKGARFVIKLPL